MDLRSTMLRVPMLADPHSVIAIPAVPIRTGVVAVGPGVLGVGAARWPLVSNDYAQPAPDPS